MRCYRLSLLKGTVYGVAARLSGERRECSLLGGVHALVALYALDSVDKLLTHYFDGFRRERAVFSAGVEYAVQQEAAALLLQLFAGEGVAVVDTAY